MNNQFEGRIFVSQNFTAVTTTQQYVKNLFPGLSVAQSRAVASLYQGIGFDTVFDQAVQVMGDCKPCRPMLSLSTNSNRFSNFRMPDVYDAAPFPRTIIQGLCHPSLLV
jgi:carboxylesterase type B